MFETFSVSSVKKIKSRRWKGISNDVNVEQIKKLCSRTLTLIPMCTDGKSALKAGVKIGNGNGRLPTCIIATTWNYKQNKCRH